VLTSAYPDSEVSKVTIGTVYADGFFGCANGCSLKLQLPSHVELFGCGGMVKPAKTGSRRQTWKIIMVLLWQIVAWVACVDEDVELGEGVEAWPCGGGTDMRLCIDSVVVFAPWRDRSCDGHLEQALGGTCHVLSSRPNLRVADDRGEQS
jgi:hypothetical protein